MTETPKGSKAKANKRLERKTLTRATLNSACTYVMVPDVALEDLIGFVHVQDLDQGETEVDSQVVHAVRHRTPVSPLFFVT